MRISAAVVREPEGTFTIEEVKVYPFEAINEAVAGSDAGLSLEPVLTLV